MSQKNVIDTKIRFEADIAAITQATKDIQANLGKLQLSAGLEKSFTSALTKLQNEISNFEAKAARGISTMGDSRALESSGKKILDLYNQLQNQIKGLGTLSNSEMSKLFPDSVGKNIKDAIKLLNDYEASHKKTQATIEQETKELKKQKAESERLKKLQEELQKTPVGNDSDFRKKNSLKRKIEEAPDKRKEILDQAQAEGVKLRKNKQEIDRHSTGSEEWVKKLELFDATIKRTQESYDALVKKLEGKIPESTLEKQMQKNQTAIQNTERKVEELEKDIKELGDTDTKGLNTTVEKINKLTKLDLKNLETGEAGIRAIDEALGGLATEELQKVRDYIDTLDESALQAVPALESLRDRLDGVGKEAKELTDTQRELENFKSNLLQFFSIGNAVQLFKRAVSSAIDTVKELDSAMTEIAVVSDYDISSMWDQLPEFTKLANELGVSIKDAYAATTLYIQQGLDFNESLALSNETLKMARIAGLDAAQATDAMTAALRGFNMELNEASALRINDVYSKLAAITASDVEEISSAMTKTASIANNANMEFETTAAFLSQIIETTRESAETAGTAMKTVIARFQELKKDPSEIGEIDGEIVDANKIETALRTIGVSLRDTQGQFRDLDDVFLEIAQKWDGLDTNTQRYIATMAAGSRQQSRFIAMMSNYDRTMELVAAANNSAGASQEQFEKTLESLESKIARLQNAWAEFIMGIANNNLVKAGVDLLAGLLETVNKLSSGFGDVGEAIVKLGASFVALKGGRILLGKIFSPQNQLKGLFSGPLGKQLFSDAERGGAKAGFSFIQKFTSTLQQKKNYAALGGKLGLFGGLFKDTSNLISPEILDKGLEDIFKNISPEQINVEGLKNAAQGALDSIDFKRPQKKEQLLALLNSDDIKNIKQASIEIEKLGGKINKTGIIAENSNINTLPTKLEAVAGAAALAGGALMGLGNMLQQSESQGWANFGTVITNLGKGLLTFGTIMSVVIPLKAQLMAAGINAAIVSIPVIGWVAGIISALIALGGVIDEFTESEKEKIENINKHLDESKKRAEETKEAYDSLLSDISEHQEAIDTLSDLTKGTEEWYRALQEVNEEVLDLIQTYPELNRYLTRGKNGELTFTSDGQETIEKVYQQRVVDANQAALSTEMYKTSEEAFNKNNAQKLVSSVMYGSNKWDKAGELLDELTTTYAKDPSRLYKEEYLNELNEKYAIKGLDTKNLEKVIEDLINQLEQSKSVPLEQEGTLKIALASGASEELLNSTYASQIQDFFAQEYTQSADEFSNKVDTRATSLQSDYTLEELKEKYMEEDSSITDISQLAGKTEEQLAREIASLQLIKEQTKAMNDFYNEFSTLSKTQQNILARIIKKDGKGLTKTVAEGYKKFANAIDEAGNITGEVEGKDIDQYFKELTNFDLTTMAASLGIRAEEFRLMLIDGAEKAIESYDIAKQQIQNILNEDAEVALGEIEAKGISSGALEGLSNQAMSILFSGGSDAANHFVQEINQIMRNLPTEDAELFIGALNGIDLTKKDSIQSFSDIIEELPIKSKIGEEALKNFEDRIIELGNVSDEITFDQLKERLKSIKEFSDDLKERDSRVFSDEEKQQLVSWGIDESQFVLNDYDEWVYIGESLEILLAEINKTTTAILGEMQGDLNYAISQGKSWDNIMQNGLEFSLYQSGGHSGLRDVKLTPEQLVDLITEGKAEDYSVSYLSAIAEAVEANITESGEEIDLTKLTSQDLFDLITKRYNEYYGPGGNILTKNEGTRKEKDQTESDRLNLARDTSRVVAEEGIWKKDIEHLLGKAGKVGVSQAIINQFNEALEKNGGKLTTSIKKILGDAIIKEEAASKLKETTEEIREITDKYEELKNITDEDIQNIGTILGFDNMEPGGENFEFIQTNLKLIGEGIEGNISSMETFQSLLAEKLNTDFEMTASFAEDGIRLDSLSAEMQEWAKGLAGTGLFTIETIPLEQKVPITLLSRDGPIKPQYETITSYVQVLKPVGADVIKKGTGIYDQKGTKKTADNKYDKHYNKLQDYNALLREREKLERNHQRLLDAKNTSGQELYEISQKELKNLAEQKKLQQDLLKLRKTEFDSLVSEGGKYSDYVGYNTEDQTIEIKWDNLESLAKSDPDKYEDVSDFIDELEEAQEAIFDVEKIISDIEDDVADIKDRGKQEYLTLEDRIVSALIERENRKIEEQEKIVEAINDAATDLMDAIQANIDKMRQDRENEKTEASIAEKERRLAYLRQDTSGANALEIKRLEKELAEEKEAYGDSLIDQALQEMQEQNDEAAEQRERQITLMQEQLEWQKETGYYAAEAHRIFEDTLQNGGLFDTNSEFYQLITSTEGWGALAHSDQMQKLEEIRKALAAAYNYLMNKKEDEVPVDYENTDYLAIINDATQRFLRGELDFNEALQIIQEAEKLRDLKINTKDANGVTYGERYNASPTNGSLAEDFWSNYGQYAGGYYDGGSANTGAPTETEEGPMHSLPEVVKSTDTANIKKMQEGLNSMKAARVIKFGADLAIDGKYGPKTQAAVKALQAELEVPQDGWWGKVTYAAFMARADLKQFKTGGLADFTGLAWLDGTKSRPEMVLNARDTENFIILKDVLSSLLHLPQADSMHGDNYFDIDVQVEEISDDYDVDQVIERVKEKIYEDSMYRNNNSISLKR